MFCCSDIQGNLVQSDRPGDQGWRVSLLFCLHSKNKSTLLRTLCVCVYCVISVFEYLRLRHIYLCAPDPLCLYFLLFWRPAFPHNPLIILFSLHPKVTWPLFLSMDRKGFQGLNIKLNFNENIKLPWQFQFMLCEGNACSSICVWIRENRFAEEVGQLQHIDLLSLFLQFSENKLISW